MINLSNADVETVLHFSIAFSTSERQALIGLLH